MHSYMLSQANHFGEEKAQELGRRMWIGHAMVGVERLQKYLGIAGDDIETVAKILQLHPHFQPRSYVDLRVAVTGARVRAAEPGRARLAWEIEIDPNAEPAAEPQEFNLARMSNGLTFRFEQRRLLRMS